MLVQATERRSARHQFLLLTQPFCYNSSMFTNDERKLYGFIALNISITIVTIILSALLSFMGGGSLYDSPSASDNIVNAVLSSAFYCLTLITSLNLILNSRNAALIGLLCTAISVILCIISPVLIFVAWVICPLIFMKLGYGAPEDKVRL